MSSTSTDFDILMKSGILPSYVLDKIKEDLAIPAVEEEPKPEPEKVNKIKYNFNMVNTNKNLKELVSKLKQSKVKQYSLLLYGEPGSGKSYFGQYLAQELGMPVIKKHASDLIERWVGATEKNIADAFAEAREKNAILLFDEADSFLINRKTAKQDYVVGQVNEMLTQMETHTLPFICTTNLKEGLDTASFRRFIFKIKYDYMTDDNIKAGVKDYFNQKINTKDIQKAELQYICPGDFSLVKKKLDILDNSDYSIEKIIEYLKEEQEEKEIKVHRKIGL